MAASRKSGPGLLVVAQNVDEVVVLSATGDIDMVTAPQLQQQVDQVLAGHPTGLVVDLLKVDFLGSAGIGVLVSAYNAAAETRFAVVATGPATQRPLHLLAVDEYIDVYPTVAQALTGVGVGRAETG